MLQPLANHSLIPHILHVAVCNLSHQLLQDYLGPRTVGQTQPRNMHSLRPARGAVPDLSGDGGDLPTTCTAVIRLQNHLVILGQRQRQRQWPCMPSLQRGLLCYLHFRPPDKPTPRYLELAAFARTHLLGAWPMLYECARASDIRVLFTSLCLGAADASTEQFFQPGSPGLRLRPPSSEPSVSVQSRLQAQTPGIRRVVYFASADQPKSISNMAQSAWKDYVLREKYIHPRKLKKILDEKYGSENYTVKVRYVWPYFGPPFLGLALLCVND